MSSLSVDFKNIFLVTLYKFALYTGGSWATFEAEVNLNGKGFDQVHNQWYSYGTPIRPISASEVLTGSQATPTAGRTIAVDSPYITRKSYDGGSGSMWHRGKVLVSGLIASGDAGNRTAEDSGSAINGYHIDVFIGFDTVSTFLPTILHLQLILDKDVHICYIYAHC